MNRNFLLLLAFSFLLASCGFRNIRGENDINHLPSFNISTSKTIEGAELYSELERLLTTSEHSRYNLDVTLTYKVSLLSISKNSEITQETVEQVVNMKLYDKVEQKNIIQDNFTMHGTVNSTLKPYSNYQEMSLTRINLAKEASQEILARLMLDFIDN